MILDLEPVLVDIDKAIPCGLILNELISNTFKYAFLNVDSGEVKISLHKFEDHEVEKIVADNGICLPVGFDAGKCDTLGLKTVFALVEAQLKGSIGMVPFPIDKGSSWRVVFTNISGV